MTKQRASEQKTSSIAQKQGGKRQQRTPKNMELRPEQERDIREAFDLLDTDSTGAQPMHVNKPRGGVSMPHPTIDFAAVPNNATVMAARLRPHFLRPDDHARVGIRTGHTLVCCRKD